MNDEDMKDTIRGSSRHLSIRPYHLYLNLAILWLCDKTNREIREMSGKERSVKEIVYMTWSREYDEGTGIFG